MGGRHGPSFLLRVLLLAAIAAVITPVPAGSPGVYTVKDALREFHGLEFLQHPADPPRRFGQLSSNDPNGGNFDQGNFLREEGLEHVLMDVRGPGVLTRLWTAEPMGVLRFYFDGAEEPQLSVLWTDLQSGEVPWLTEPFVTSAGGGSTMRFPLPFAESLKVTLTGQTWCHWQIHYQYFPPDTEVETWHPGLGLEDAAESVYKEASAAWEDPAGAAVPGEVIASDMLHLAGMLEPYRFRAGEDMLLTEIALVQAPAGPLPGDLFVSIRGADGEALLEPVPWAAMAGLWEAEGDSPSLLHGRIGQRSYFRVPFLLEEESVLEFSWQDGAEGEFVGEVELHGRPAHAGEDLPGLLAVWHVQDTGGGERVAPPEFSADGRLLLVATRVAATGSALYIEGDEYIYLEGEEHASIRGTGTEDLFDSAWYFMNGPFATAMAGSPLQEEGLMEMVARATWWPFGIPFAGELRFELQAGPHDDAPPTRYELLLAGQSFGPGVETAPPRRAASDRTGMPTGTRKSSGVDAAGLPVYTEQMPFVEGGIRPFEEWFQADSGAFEGTASFRLHPENALGFFVFLDLPYGWTGELRPAGREPVEVYDIGWPPVAWDDPEPGLYEFAWSARPPERIPPGNYVVQIRAHAYLTDGSEETIHRQMRLLAEPRGEPDYEWPASALSRAEDGTYHLELPRDFETRPGDSLAIEATVNERDGRAETQVLVEFSPVTYSNEEEPLYHEVLLILADVEDGLSRGRSLLGGTRHWATVPVGRDRSWLSPVRELRFSWPDVPAGTVDVHRVRLYRHPALPDVQGWSGNLPFVETRPGTFELPAASKVLEGVELRRAMHREVAVPRTHIAPEFRQADLLENITAGLMRWRVADPPHRDHRLRSSLSLLFPAANVGERIRIEHESLRGARYIAIQFGFGPWCGRAGVRDCEGRLVAVRDLYMNKPRILPQYTWVILPVPNRDPWIYLEALGPAPGSFETRIPVHRVMVLREEP